MQYLLAPKARLCVLHHWPGFKGYGFNLQSKKGDIGKALITNVEANSPSSYVGLKEQDNVLRVNGESTELLSHQEVTEKIKSNAYTVSLLVVDKYTVEYYDLLGQDINTIPLETRTCLPIRPGEKMLDEMIYQMLTSDAYIFCCIDSFLE